ncbi:Uncharacterised protein [uncultured archaeon]|nr:Uncharacterised protein [uncultured archaeon]
MRSTIRDWEWGGKKGPPPGSGPRPPKPVGFEEPHGEFELTSRHVFTGDFQFKAEDVMFGKYRQLHNSFKSLMGNYLKTARCFGYPKRNAKIKIHVEMELM